MKLYEWKEKKEPTFLEYAIILEDQVIIGFNYNNDIERRDWDSESITDNPLWIEVSFGTI